MTVGDIKEKLGLKALCENEDSLSREVTGGYCGDLLSWVMSPRKGGGRLMTVMGNVNSHRRGGACGHSLHYFDGVRAPR